MNISGNSTVSVEAAGSTQLKLKHPLAFKRKLAIYTGILALLLAIFTGMSLGIVNLTWQEPEILLLDEPTTYLDIRHQLELMDLIHRLHEELNLTVMMVLHDLNHAARYSDRIIALKDGKIIADGKVEDVFKEQLIRQLYGVENKIFTMEQAGHKELICLPSDVIRENMQAGVAV